MSAPQPGRYHADYTQRGYITHDLPRNAIQPTPAAALARFHYAPPRTTLTQREEQIADLTACGATQQDVARELGISPHTVKNHLGAIYRISNVLSSAELACLRYNGTPYSWGGAPDAHANACPDATLDAALTPHQVRIANLIACGATQQQAARALKLTTQAIKNNLSEMYRLCGVTSAVELACLRHGGVPYSWRTSR